MSKKHAKRFLVRNQKTVTLHNMGVKKAKAGFLRRYQDAVKVMISSH